jgi:hypothetical protein
VRSFFFSCSSVWFGGKLIKNQRGEGKEELRTGMTMKHTNEKNEKKTPRN